MTNYIKFNQILKSVSGFTTDEAVLFINNYNLNINRTVNAVAASPMPTPGNSVSINFSLYKSLIDKDNAEQPFQVKNTVGDVNVFPFTVFSQYDDGAGLTEEDVYEIVLNKFTELGYQVTMEEAE